MTRVLVTALTLIVLVAAAPAGDTKTEPGFTSLFNGKNLDGWHIMNKGQFSVENEKPAGTEPTKNKVILLNKGGGWLRSDKEYEDFVLTVEVRWLKPKQDSGIFIRASKEGKNWPDKKVEVQCENSARVAMLFGARHTLDKEKAAKALKGVNEWNTFEVRCVGTRCEVKLNGELVCTSDDVKLKKGYVGFQGENGHLDFRNVRIKVIREKE